MTDPLELCAQVLGEAGFSTNLVQDGEPKGIVFENDTIAGFVLAYGTVQALVDGWQLQLDAMVLKYQFGLRRAGDKAWNTYAVLIASQAATDAQSIVLGSIEENLVGTRKIARSGVIEISDARDALESLLPVQSAPKLEAVDMIAEIRLRTTELTARSVDAFLSEADESVVLAVLEEGT